MPDFRFSTRPLFRSNAADNRHGAVIADALAASGETPTPTKVLRYALRRAATEIHPSANPDEIADPPFPARRRR